MTVTDDDTAALKLSETKKTVNEENDDDSLQTIHSCTRHRAYK